MHPPEQGALFSIRSCKLPSLLPAAPWASVPLGAGVWVPMVDWGGGGEGSAQDECLGNESRTHSNCQPRGKEGQKVEDPIRCFHGHYCAWLLSLGPKLFLLPVACYCLTLFTVAQGVITPSRHPNTSELQRGNTRKAVAKEGGPLLGTAPEAA